VPGACACAAMCCAALWCAALWVPLAERGWKGLASCASGREWTRELKARGRRLPLERGRGRVRPRPRYQGTVQYLVLDNLRVHYLYYCQVYSAARRNIGTLGQPAVVLIMLLVAARRAGGRASRDANRAARAAGNVPTLHGVPEDGRACRLDLEDLQDQPGSCQVPRLTSQQHLAAAGGLGRRRHSLVILAPGACRASHKKERTKSTFVYIIHTGGVRNADCSCGLALALGPNLGSDVARWELASIGSGSGRGARRARGPPCAAPGLISDERATAHRKPCAGLDGWMQWRACWLPCWASLPPRWMPWPVSGPDPFHFHFEGVQLTQITGRASIEEASSHPSDMSSSTSCPMPQSRCCCRPRRRARRELASKSHLFPARATVQFINHQEPHPSPLPVPPSHALSCTLIPARFWPRVRWLCVGPHRQSCMSLISAAASEGAREGRSGQGGCRGPSNTEPGPICEMALSPLPNPHLITRYGASASMRCCLPPHSSKSVANLVYRLCLFLAASAGGACLHMCTVYIACSRAPCAEPARGPLSFADVSLKRPVIAFFVCNGTGRSHPRGGCSAVKVVASLLLPRPRARKKSLPLSRHPRQRQDTCKRRRTGPKRNPEKKIKKNFQPPTQTP